MCAEVFFINIFFYCFAAEYAHTYTLMAACGKDACEYDFESRA